MDQDGGRQRRWEQISHDEHLPDVFVLEDETAAIAVLPQSSDITIVSDASTVLDLETESGSELSEAGRAYLTRLREQSLSGVFASGTPRLRVRERRIEVGSPINVVATLARAADVRLPPMGVGAPIVSASSPIGWSVSIWLSRLERFAAQVGLSSPRFGNSGSVGDQAGQWAVESGRQRALDPQPLPSGIRPHDMVVWSGSDNQPFMTSVGASANPVQPLDADTGAIVIAGMAGLAWGLWLLRSALIGPLTSR